MNADADWNTAREGATTKRKDTNPPQTTTKEYRFKHTNNKKNNTSEKCDPIKLELSYIQKAQQRRAWPQREGEERVHLLYCISVTAPVFHFDTSELNTDKPSNTAREGATKKKKDQPTTNNKKGTVSKTQTQNNKTCENFVIR